MEEYREKNDVKPRKEDLRRRSLSVISLGRNSEVNVAFLKKG